MNTLVRQVGRLNPSALCFSLSAIALGRAIQFGNGFYNPTALGWMTGALVLALIGVLLHRLREAIPEGGVGILVTVMAAGIAWQVAELLTGRPGFATRNDASMPLFNGLVILQAAGVVAGVARLRFSRQLWFPFVLGASLCLGVWMVRASPDPYIDVIAVHKEAINAWLNGKDPYRISFPNIYEPARAKEFYNPAALAGNRVMFSYPYPPASFYFAVPGQVLVDEKHLGRAGITELSGFGAELQGKHARVVGVMHDRKLFSTACLIVTDLDNGRRYIGLSANRVSYLAVKCCPGADVAVVRQRLAAQLADQDVLTAREFHNLTQDYWIRLTGIGPVLLLGAALGALVGFITVFLTFSHLTAEKLPVYAALKAMGASTGELAGLILSQIALVFAVGALVAVAGVVAALAVLAHTTISVSITSGVWAVGIGSMALCSFAAGVHALRLLAAVEPAEAFKV